MKRRAFSIVSSAVLLAASLMLAAQALAGRSASVVERRRCEKAIVDFVQATTTQGNAKFVPPERVYLLVPAQAYVAS